MPAPQLPPTIVVIPCMIKGFMISPQPLRLALNSTCVWISTIPGMANRSAISMTECALAPESIPIVSILSPLIAMSALKGGFPVPSTMMPLIRR